MKPVIIGLLGCGKISDQYFAGCRRYEVLEIAACADLDVPRAQAQAQKYSVRPCSVDDLFADPDIELIVNLTVPQAHVETNERALRSGKHVYTEKPFALDLGGCVGVRKLARERGLLVGSAPDTILGGGFQTARAVLDGGRCGRPVAALAFMMNHGPESWHPSPAFYYKKGGGPLFDMGPYYLTALVHLLGPAVSVAGVARRSFPERLITSSPLAGTKITVEVPTHYCASVEFENGAIATVVMSFDVWPGPVLPRVVVYGSEGTVEVPDPNRFDGEVRVRAQGQSEMASEPMKHAIDRGRGTGVADLAYSIRRPGREFRTEAAIAEHVLEIMVAIEQAAATSRHTKLTTSCSRPRPLPPGLPSNVLDP